MIAPIATGIVPVQTENSIENGLSIANSAPKDANFTSVLEGLVGSANQAERYAHGASEAFAAGARDDIHGTMIAISKADIELHLVGTVRNKVIDAFYELWRMQI